MDIYNSLFTHSSVLNEQIARQVFEVLPEGGLLIAIVDREGHFWPSNSESFSKLNLSESFLSGLRERIDDGTEPVVTQIEHYSIVAAQLATDRTNCGYVIIALPQQSPESTLNNIELIEVLLNQICLIAKLIEKNNQLYELQIKQFDVYGHGQAASN